MIIFLVEEYSMKKFLEGILPRLDFEKQVFEIKPHRGKEDLLENLNKIIPTLSKRAQQIMVILDKDREDCKILKSKIVEKMQNCVCDYKVRIACYELETWFLGDMEAIAKCYPKFKPERFRNKEKYRYIDGIEKPSDMVKIYASKPKFAEKMAEVISLDLEVNHSHSFCVLFKTLITIRETL